jgi:PAS domain S-box-containing protein
MSKKKSQAQGQTPEVHPLASGPHGTEARKGGGPSFNEPKTDLFDLFFRHAPAAIAMLDKTMRYICVSDRWCQDYRLAAQDMIGRSHYDVFPEIPERWKEIHRRCLAGAVERSDEEPFPRQDGSVDWVKWAIHPWLDANGEIGGIIVLTEVITQKKLTEIALQEQEARLNVIAGNLPLTIYRFSNRRGGLYFSSGVKEVLGRTAAELLAEPMLWHDSIHPDDLPMVDAAIAESTLDQRRIDLVYRILDCSGRERWLSDHALCLRQPDGELILDGVAQDITERKRAEEALAVAKEKFAKVFDLSPDAMDLIHVETGCLADVNRSFLRLFGYNRPEIIGRSPLPGAATIWADPAEYGRFVASVAEHGQVRGYETLLRRKDGSVFPASISATVLDIAGQRHRMSIIQDITKRIQDGEALRISEERYQRITNAITDYVYRVRVNPAGGLETWHSPGCLAVTGYQPEEFANDPHLWIRMVAAEDAPRVEEQLRTIKAGQHPPPLDHRIIHKNGSVRWVRNTFVPNPSDPGAGLIYEGLLQDITEHKEAEAEKARLEAQLHESHRMESLGVLAAGVAHNLNNVLAIIMGSASLREQLTTEPADREAYRNIGKACQRGRDVVKSMLSFAKPALSLWAPFDLHAILEELRSLLESTTRNTIAISVSLAHEPLWVNGDASNIHQVLLNICLNSINAMPTGGILAFRTAILEGDWVEVSVEDNGTGMTPDVLARALEPFFTTGTGGRGLGLGLSMTYGIVQAHGGTLNIASQPGIGTTVRLRFPRIPAPLPGQRASPLASSCGPLSVFLVDDDEDVLLLMTRMLKRAGARQVKTFSGGEAVLAELRAGERPDLLILDQNMPGLNGIQTLERVRARDPELPILISSGQPDIEAWAVFRRPKVAVISKPFTMKEIQTKLAQFTDAAAPGPDGPGDVGDGV